LTESASAVIRRLGAVALGIALAATPFLQFGTGGGHGHVDGAHRDHAPYRGGVLQMVGDHHVEIVATDDVVLAFTSDAWRRPLRPAAAVAEFETETRVMTWSTDHFEVSDPGDYHRVSVTVALQSGEELHVAVPGLSGAPR
jgi:hypothetical protein